MQKGGKKLTYHEQKTKEKEMLQHFLRILYFAICT